MARCRQARGNGAYRTSPEDLAGMAVAEGILTARGGMTSHAALWLAAWVSAAYPVRER